MRTRRKYKIKMNITRSNKNRNTQFINLRSQFMFNIYQSSMRRHLLKDELDFLN